MTEREKMKKLSILFIILFVLLLSACSGEASVDEAEMDKVLKEFKIGLVKTKGGASLGDMILEPGKMSLEQKQKVYKIITEEGAEAMAKIMIEGAYGEFAPDRYDSATNTYVSDVHVDSYTVTEFSGEGGLFDKE